MSAMVITLPWTKAGRDCLRETLDSVPPEIRAYVASLSDWDEAAIVVAELERELAQAGKR